LNDYLILFLIVLGINLLPAFGPPTWSVIVIYGLNTTCPPHGLCSAVLWPRRWGALLAQGFRRLGGRLPERQRRNLAAARGALETKRRNVILALGLFALSPLPSAQLSKPPVSLVSASSASRPHSSSAEPCLIRSMRHPPKASASPGSATFLPTV
jgi:hypothetical protein